MYHWEKNEKDYFEQTQNRMELCEQGIIENWQRQGMEQEIGMMYAGRLPIEMEQRRRQMDLENK